MSNAKKYDLNDIEKQYLNVIIQQHNALMSNTFSYFAITRLGYEITPKTMFKLDKDIKTLEIYESDSNAPEAAAGIVGDK
jgi:hypothetical protein